MLTITQTVVALTALGLIAILYGLWTGTTPEQICLPTAIVGIGATIGAMWYASKHLTDKTGGETLSSWSGLIRNMAMINGLVSLAVAAYPLIS